MEAKTCHDCFWALAMPDFKTPSGSVSYCCHPKARAKAILAPVVDAARSVDSMCGPSAKWFKSIPPDEFIPIVRGVSARPQRVNAPQYTTPRNRVPYKAPV